MCFWHDHLAYRLKLLYQLIAARMHEAEDLKGLTPKTNEKQILKHKTD